MSNIYKEIIKNYYKNFPQDFSGSLGAKEIENAEKELKIKFAPDYKAFLKKYGGGAFEGNYIFGLRRINSMDSELWSVIQNTNFYRSQKWPGIENWYIVSDDGRGNPIGIDPDSKVWLSDHDAGFEQIKLADSFEEFLYKLHTDTLYQ